MELKNKVFVDSNIWFSIFWGSVELKKIINRLARDWEVYVSEQVLVEVIRNIKQKLPKELSKVNDFFSTYPVQVVKDPGKLEVKRLVGLADLKDLPLLAGAIRVNCDWFLTGNIKDFKVKAIKHKFKLLVISPSDFVEYFDLLDKKFIRSIKKARKELKEGKVLSHEEVFAD